MLFSLNSPVILFTHFGYSSYLECTLAAARKTNPEARLIFLGDEKNRVVAVKNGWEHYLYENYPSELSPQFDALFHHVQGPKHSPIKNGKDWLRYVFERWFYIDGFIKQAKIHRFWHFDSDTMILQNLEPHNQKLSNIDFTVQCNGICLNGIVTDAIVTEFCQHILDLYADKEFLLLQQTEFNTIHPNWAFTEMRAFEDYLLKTHRPWVRLLNYDSDFAFDEAIRQAHSFQMGILPNGDEVKNIYSLKGKIFGIRAQKIVEFVTLNLSVVPDYVFDWSLAALNGKSSVLIEEQSPSPLRETKKMKNILDKLQRKLRHLLRCSDHQSQLSSLEKIIDPEITNDPFFDDLMKYASDRRLKTFLEIGSSSGGGSTEAFVTAIRQRADKESVYLYCMELSKPRFELLSKTYLADKFVRPYNLSSISSKEFPSESNIVSFYKKVPTKLNNAKLKTVLEWYAADLAYIQKSGNDLNGIEFIKRDQSINQFDMVLIDGSEFTGERELELVIGANVIALDDTETYKCHAALRRLSKDQRYRLITHRPEVRNGYAIFERKDFNE